MIVADIDNTSSDLNDIGATDPVADIVIPLHGETATVTRRVVPGALVRVSTKTVDHAQNIDETVYEERIEIERRPIGRVITVDPGIVENGDVTIIPVISETIVTERRLMLIEEVHVRRVRVPRSHHETIVLRRQEAVVERIPAASPADETNTIQPTTLQGANHDS